MNNDQDDLFGEADEKQMMNQNFDASVNKKKNIYFQEKLNELRQIQGKIDDEQYNQIFNEGFEKGKKIANLESKIDFKIVEFKVLKKDLQLLIQLKQQLKQNENDYDQIEKELNKII